MEETWKSLIENFKDVAIKEMKIVLTSKKIKDLRKTTLKDAVEGRKGDTVEIKEIVRLPISLHKMEEKDLTEILKTDIDYFN